MILNEELKNKIVKDMYHGPMDDIPKMEEMLQDMCKELNLAKSRRYKESQIKAIKDFMDAYKVLELLGIRTGVKFYNDSDPLMFDTEGKKTRFSFYNEDSGLITECIIFPK